MTPGDPDPTPEDVRDAADFDADVFAANAFFERVGVAPDRRRQCPTEFRAGVVAEMLAGPGRLPLRTCPHREGRTVDELYDGVLAAVRDKLYDVDGVDADVTAELYDSVVADTTEVILALRSASCATCSAVLFEAAADKLSAATRCDRCGENPPAGGWWAMLRIHARTWPQHAREWGRPAPANGFGPLVVIARLCEVCRSAVETAEVTS